MFGSLHLGTIKLGARLIPALGLVAFLVAPAALAAGPQQVSLAAKEFSYTPNTVNLTVGQPVQLAIVNQGLVDHDLKSDIPIANLSYQKADNPPDEQKDNIAKNTLDVDFGKGVTAQVTFTPTKAGTYEFRCDLPGHTEAGMKGTFIVAAAGAPGTPAAVPASLPKTGGGGPGMTGLLWIVGGVLLVLAGAGARIHRVLRSR